MEKGYCYALEDELASVGGESNYNGHLKETLPIVVPVRSTCGTHIPVKTGEFGGYGYPLS